MSPFYFSSRKTHKRNLSLCETDYEAIMNRANLLNNNKVTQLILDQDYAITMAEHLVSHSFYGGLVRAMVEAAERNGCANAELFVGRDFIRAGFRLRGYGTGHVSLDLNLVPRANLEYLRQRAERYQPEVVEVGGTIPDEPPAKRQKPNP